jgi:DNA-binding MarR family transcriptional regulator
MSAKTSVRSVAPSKPSADSAAAHAAFALAFKRATAAVRRLRGRDTHRHGELSYAQYGLLFGLAQNGEMCASDLATCADVAPGTATQMLDGLVASGLVQRTRSEVDRRSVLLTLTDRGMQVLGARRAEYEERWARSLASFSAAELRIAAAVLDRTREMFDESLRDVDGPSQIPPVEPSKPHN